MIIKNNKKLNILDYVPELKKFEKNGILFDSIEGDNDYIAFNFYKKRNDSSILEGRVAIYFKEDEEYTKEDILTMLELNLKGFYDKK